MAHRSGQPGEETRERRAVAVVVAVRAPRVDVVHVVRVGEVRAAAREGRLLLPEKSGQVVTDRAVAVVREAWSIAGRPDERLELGPQAGVLDPALREAPLIDPGSVRVGEQ